ncbi:MAG: DUF4391 domain-containing protein [Lachnoclostridium sp.]|nr:DUF4391 domain-containing protein [Lachnospira sp.]MCM1247152.1 DUF4391 domain-containing protein [Lachnoclostridium sp.]
MFNIPEHYNTDVELTLKNLIPKDLKPNDKKRIKDAVKEVRLVYQIAGEEIPSVINDEYRCEVIQFYDMELNNIKEAPYLASVYQNLIKPLCVFHMHDSRYELYSFAVKRLNQVDENQIVVDDSILTKHYPMGLPDDGRDKLLKYLDYVQIKNKTNKLNLYREWYYRTYMIMNENAYSNTGVILDGNVWYDSKHIELVYEYYKELVDTRGMLKKAVTGAEKVNLNKEIKAIIQELKGHVFSGDANVSLGKEDQL